MMIYNKNGVRVMQHPFLYRWDVQVWMEGDDPRSYGRKWDYFTVEQCTKFDRVQELVNRYETANSKE